jgi:hypothetical protein
MEKKKIIRVEIEREDGSVIRVLDNEAEKWAEITDSMASYAYAHGASYDNIHWEEVAKSK